MIGLGIVGLGRWGRQHAAAAIESGRFKIVVAAAVEADAETRDFAASHGVTLVESIDDVLRTPGVDALSIATPHSLHAAQIQASAKSGKHVLCEKPFCLTGEEARAAVEACAKAGVVVAVGTDNRHYRAIEEMRAAIASGRIGQPFHVEAVLTHNLMRRTGGASGQARQSSAWRFDRNEAPAGPMAHLGIHRIDSFVHFFGPVASVYAVATPPIGGLPYPASVHASVRFCNGMTGSVMSSLDTPLDSRMQVYGSGGWIAATGPSDYPSYLRASLTHLTVMESGKPVETRDCGTVNSVCRNFTAFADAIEGKTPYPLGADEIVQVVEFLEAISTSIVRAAPVTIAKA